MTIALAAVVIPLSVVIPFSVAIPVVIVRNPAVISLPVTVEETLAVVMWRNPMRTGIGRPSPISVMPFVVVSGRIPIAPLGWAAQLVQRAAAVAGQF